MSEAKTFVLQTIFESIENQGIEKVIEMLKLTLNEAPRLQGELIAKDKESQERARKETLYAIDAIEKEVLKLSTELGKDPSAIWEMVYQSRSFTPSVWDRLQFYTKFIQDQKIDLNKKIPTSKKPSLAPRKKSKFKV
jgi:hypothetical protein